MNIIIDLVSDWHEAIKSQLVSAGYGIPAGEPPHETAVRYFDIRRRFIIARPRVVHESSVLAVPAEVQAGYAFLKRKIEKGDDLKPHLSRDVSKARRPDGLLNDWGIYHLHLGTTVEPDDFVTRTGPVAYTRIDDNDAYIVTVQDHGAWSERAIIETIHREWPETIRAYRVTDAVELSWEPSDSEIAKLRAKGMSCMFTLSDGSVYLGPGGGVTTAKTGVASAMKHNDNIRLIRRAQKRFLESSSQIAQLAEAENVRLPDPAVFRLAEHDGAWMIRETTTGFAVPFDDFLHE